MFLGTLIVALAFAWLRRGRLAALADAPLRWIWAIVGAFLLPIILQRVSDWGVPLQSVTPPLYILSLLVLLLALWQNRRIAGISLIGVGAMLNLIVIAANQGHMPVSESLLAAHGATAAIESLKSGQALTHTLMSARTHLGFLADIWFLPYPRPTLFSMGDLIECIGLFWTVQALTPPKRPAVGGHASSTRPES